MTRIGRVSMAIAAAALAAPAALFFFAAIGRSLQPTSHEPSRTLDALVAWFFNLAGPGLLALLVILPIAGLLAAAVLIRQTWTSDPSLRSDLASLARATLPIVRRPELIVAVLVVVFGVVYFAALLVHAIAG